MEAVRTREALTHVSGVSETLKSTAEDFEILLECWEDCGRRVVVGGNEPVLARAVTGYARS
jgi:hypothetical protein